ncbi:MAG: polysaccharide biosynthesis protein [Anaerolineae bacterium]|nr:polysaccharide biosynthesis protein [Anaerolineae bacterium]
METPIYFLIALVTSTLFTEIIRRYTLQRGIVDVPNQRSSHVKTTPRGGGLAVVAVSLSGWLLFFWLSEPNLSPPFWAAFGGALLIAAVSWLDDMRPLSYRLRLGAHLLAAGLVLWQVGSWQQIELPLVGLVNLGWFGPFMTLIWLVGATNAYNFMDGLDGLAGSQGVIAGLGWGILGLLAGQPAVSMLGFLLAAGCLGFLTLNWPPAKIFMGDVGSAFLGFTLALLPLLSAVNPLGGSVWPGAVIAGLLLLWPFVYDAGFTFIRRLMQGENVFAAHRSHLYQRLTIVGYTHISVTTLYTGLALIGLLLALGWAYDISGSAVIILTFMPLVCFTLYSYVSAEEVIATDIAARANGRGPSTAVPTWALNLIPALRNRHFFMLDALTLLLTPAIALTLRLDELHWWPEFGQALLVYTGVSLLIKLYIFYQMGLYTRYWRYASINDLVPIGVSTTFSALILIILFAVTQPTLAAVQLAVPRTLPIMDGLITAVVISTFRLGVRALYHYHQRHSHVPGRRVLIVGAGEAGSLVVKEMRANPQLEMEPIAFVDDDPAKQGIHIQGLPVVGSSQDILQLTYTYNVQRIVIAIPSAPLGRQQEIMALCRKSGLTLYSLPGVYELLAGHKTISQLPQVDIQRLLRRQAIETDHSRVATSLAGATVLVTGAGGSIGSELCRQIARCNPAKIILLGHGENSIFEIGLDLRLTFPQLITQPAIVDVRDRQRVEAVVKQHRPDIIFHAAAHKHVPFMQDNTEEALTNNVQGTQNVLRAAEQYGVARFVLISTDKAVNPSSIMGATKRLAELLVISTAQRTGRAYMAVRFGNVLGSRGSVIPIFQRQIAAGGPLTITHPSMRRYFMTIPEAVQLVLQSSVLGKGGDIFVLDMGQQVRILDLAVDLIKLSGLEPEQDIKIIYSGIRPGEKLAEELFLENEAYGRTSHPKIFTTAYEGQVNMENLGQTINHLVELARKVQTLSDREQSKLLLSRICHAIEQHQPGAARQKANVRVEDAAFDTSYPRPLSAKI